MDYGGYSNFCCDWAVVQHMEYLSQVKLREASERAGRFIDSHIHLLVSLSPIKDNIFLFIFRRLLCCILRFAEKYLHVQINVTVWRGDR
jgi:hypothetical protein